MCVSVPRRARPDRLLEPPDGGAEGPSPTWRGDRRGRRAPLDQVALTPVADLDPSSSGASPFLFGGSVSSVASGSSRGVPVAARQQIILRRVQQGGADICDVDHPDQA